MTIYEQIERAVDFIEASLTGVRQEAAAREAGMSVRSFQGYFWAVTGHSFGEYVVKRRLALALAALGQTDKRVLEVALDVGYQSHEALTRAFQHEYGVTPLQPVGLRVSDPFGVDFEDDFGEEGAANRDSRRLMIRNRPERRPNGPKGRRPLDLGRGSGRPMPFISQVIARL